MAVFRRGKWWWTDFSVNGQRFRQPLDTTDSREALKNEKEKIGQAQTGKLSVAGQSFARLAFTEAAERSSIAAARTVRRGASRKSGNC